MAEVGTLMYLVSVRELLASATILKIISAVMAITGLMCYTRFGVRS